MGQVGLYWPSPFKAYLVSSIFKAGPISTRAQPNPYPARCASLVECNLLADVITELPQQNFFLVEIE